MATLLAAIYVSPCRRCFRYAPTRSLSFCERAGRDRAGVSGSMLQMRLQQLGRRPGVGAVSREPLSKRDSRFGEGFSRFQAD